MEKLDKFISKATLSKMVDFWDDPRELQTKVLAALYKAFSRKPRPGWIRTQSDNVAEEMAGLIEENRALRNQVELLSSQATDSRPLIRPTLNHGKALELSYVLDEQLRLTPAPNIAPIEWSDIPQELVPFMSKADLIEYNEGLPSPEALDQNLR